MLLLLTLKNKEDWVISKNLNTYLYGLKNISSEIAIFIATRHEKADVAVIQIGKIISFILNFYKVRKYKKNQIRVMIYFHSLLELKSKN